MDYATAETTIKQMLLKNKQHTVLQQVIDYLYNTFSHYTWIGIYLLRNETLVLGPWQGKQPTEHTSIPIGKGVCGSAAQSGKTEIVGDVSHDPRYLSCFLSTKSEIVVPIKKNNKVLGEIDIDSDSLHAFDTKDAEFLEHIAQMLSDLIS